MIRSNDDYSDIMNVKRPEPWSYIRMQRKKRAAQFAPFAALSGYGEQIEETRRWANEVQAGEYQRVPDPADPRFFLGSSSDALRYSPRKDYGRE